MSWKIDVRKLGLDSHLLSHAQYVKGQTVVAVRRDAVTGT